MYTKYWIEGNFIYGPKYSGQFWISGDFIYGPKNNGKYWISGGFIYGPTDNGLFGLMETLFMGRMKMFRGYNKKVPQ